MNHRSRLFLITVLLLLAGLVCTTTMSFAQIPPTPPDAAGGDHLQAMPPAASGAEQSTATTAQEEPDGHDPQLFRQLLHRLTEVTEPMAVQPAAQAVTQTATADVDTAFRMRAKSGEIMPIPPVLRGDGLRHGSAPGLGGAVRSPLYPPQAGQAPQALTNFTALQAVSNVQDYPWRAAVKLFVFHDELGTDRDLSCSGALIDPMHVITSGNCVFNQSSDYGWATEIWVAPAYAEGDFPYGIGVAGDDTWVLNGWYDNADFDYALGYLLLDRPIGAIVGWYGVGYRGSDNDYRTHTFQNPGYPTLDTNGEFLYNWYGSFDTVYAETLRHNRFFSDARFGGSGAFTWQDKWIEAIYTHIIGETQSGYTRITQDKFNTINATITDNTPDTIDLIPLDVHVSPATVRAGEQFATFDYLIHNYSAAGWDGVTDVEVYLSTNSDISTADTLLHTAQTFSNSAIAPKGWLRINSSNPPRLPSNLAPGDYYIGIRLLDRYSTTANNESDGWDAAPIRVVAQPTSTPTRTPTRTPTPRPTNTPLPTPTDTAQPTPTRTPLPTQTLLPTHTSTATQTSTAFPTHTPTDTPQQPPTATPTLTPTRVPAGSGDTYESDDACSEARPINLIDEVQEHTFHIAGDVDWVKFTTVANQNYRLEVVVPDGSPADVVLGVFQTCDTESLQAAPITAPGVRVDYPATVSGTTYLRLRNVDSNTAGNQVRYRLYVRPTSVTNGVVVIVAGRNSENDPLQGNIHNVTNTVFELFQAKGYTTEEIRYLAANPALSAWENDVATADNLRAVITEWAATRLQDGQSFTLYLIDHGSQGKLYLDGNDEFVTPAQLNEWLQTLERSHDDLKVNIIIEACYAGSFLQGANQISGQGRVVIASSPDNQLAYASRNGAYFSDYFLTSLQQGRTLGESFREASAYVNRLFPLQSPWLDGNGNGVVNEDADLRLASERGFAQGTFNTNWWPPLITGGTGPTTIANHSGQLQAIVNEDEGNIPPTVWAVVYPPGYTVPTSNEQMILEEDQLRVTLNPSAQDPTRYSATYHGFVEPGQYRVVLHAVDHHGLEARPVTFTVTVGGKLYLPLILRGR